MEKKLTKECFQKKNKGFYYIFLDFDSSCCRKEYYYIRAVVILNLCMPKEQLARVYESRVYECSGVSNGLVNKSWGWFWFGSNKAMVHFGKFVVITMLWCRDRILIRLIVILVGNKVSVEFSSVNHLKVVTLGVRRGCKHGWTSLLLLLQTYKIVLIRFNTYLPTYIHT